MKFTPKDKMYKLVESEHMLAIVESTMNVKGGNPLIIGHVGDIITYLDRFLYERERGLDLRAAHEAALKTANITQTHSSAIGRSSIITSPPFPKKH